MKFIDEAKIFVKSGDGGDGCLSFRREKYIEFGGPDGGNGGKGGDIILEGTKSLNTLVDFRYQKHFKAQKGRGGSGRNRTGAAGNDLILKIPVGTEILLNEEIIADIVDDEKVILFPGGKGGMGNINFKSSTNRAPRKATPGEKGHEAEIILRLKILADAGLVGFPNAGKSPIISLKLLPCIDSGIRLDSGKFILLNLGAAISAKSIGLILPVCFAVPNKYAASLYPGGKKGAAVLIIPAISFGTILPAIFVIGLVTLRTAFLTKLPSPYICLGCCILDIAILLFYFVFVNKSRLGMITFTS